MNISAALLEEQLHLKVHALQIAEYACSSTERFHELMLCFLSNDYRLAQRAAWSVSLATQKDQTIIQPYLEELVSLLNKKNVHAAVIRNSVRILQKIKIPGALHGELMNSCFGLIETPSTPVAIKAFALTTVYNLSKDYPEIKNELTLIIEERWNHETIAFKERAAKILKELEKN